MILFFYHYESGVTMVSFVLVATKSDQTVICTYLVMTHMVYYSIWRIWQTCNVKMGLRDGSVLDINVTYADLGQKCLQLLGMHALSDCDTTSYPYGKGKVTALNTMVYENYRGLATICDIGTTHTILMNAAMLVFAAIYSKHQEHTWNLLATIYSQRQRRNP